ncbi:hypothetical protein LEP1GSC193_2107 [Leptospira alstonii serovar Pingchang str. 80-412]|uniref:Uncharacterized protein n=2 Tax=Leptospira alstonii TaxID=28452 RepID=M6D096_9LEPT|nr:hypothetical protein LEP1GSC194_0490 [Leptospira alstonii serovar Sichuan str. 79601]EQA79876.1 hypothetical protein LEP1GSC193_2107 [Leptospira alstonii serovar Pingchang str. 80-412]
MFSNSAFRVVRLFENFRERNFFFVMFTFFLRQNKRDVIALIKSYPIGRSEV